jgi:hypothetical protein
VREDQSLDDTLPPSPSPSPGGGFAQKLEIEHRIDEFISVRIQ